MKIAAFVCNLLIHLTGADTGAVAVPTVPQLSLDFSVLLF